MKKTVLEVVAAVRRVVTIAADRVGDLVDPVDVDLEGLAALDVDPAAGLDVDLAAPDADLAVPDADPADPAERPGPSPVNLTRN